MATGGPGPDSETFIRGETSRKEVIAETRRISEQDVRTTMHRQRETRNTAGARSVRSKLSYKSTSSRARAEVRRRRAELELEYQRRVAEQQKVIREAERDKIKLDGENKIRKLESEDIKLTAENQLKLIALERRVQEAVISEETGDTDLEDEYLTIDEASSIDVPQMSVADRISLMDSRSEAPNMRAQETTTRQNAEQSRSDTINHVRDVEERAHSRAQQPAPEESACDESSDEFVTIDNASISLKSDGAPSIGANSNRARFREIPVSTTNATARKYSRNHHDESNPISKNVAAAPRLTANTAGLDVWNSPLIASHMANGDTSRRRNVTPTPISNIGTSRHYSQNLPGIETADNYYYPNSRNWQPHVESAVAPSHVSEEQKLFPAGNELRDQYQANLNPMVGETLPKYHHSALPPDPSRVKIKAQIFRGDPLEYQGFIHQFEHLYSAMYFDEISRLALLIQHCEGHAKELVSGFRNRGLRCYTAARNRLDEEYGDPIPICNDLIRDLREGPRVKSGDPESWKEFYHALECCYNNVASFEREDDLNRQTDIAEIVARLPNYERREWQRHCGEIYRNEKREAIFTDLLKYVKKCRQDLTTGSAKSLQSVLNKNDRKPAPQRVRANVTSVTSRQDNKSAGRAPTTENTVPQGEKKPPDKKPQHCIDCAGQHPLYQCPSFQSKTQEQRHDFVTQKNLCRNCLRAKHTAKFCKNESRCKIDGCGGKHHTLLHRHTKPDNTRDETCIQSSCTQVNIDDAVTSVVQSFDSGIKYMPIVPLRLTGASGKQIITWGFIDEGCSVSFCHQKLIDMLDLKANEINYTRETVNGTNKVKGFTVDLRVEGLNGEYPLHFKNMTTIEKIPVKPNSYPEEIDLKLYPHLEGVELPSINSQEVLIILGADVPLIQCTEVKLGRENHPSALKKAWGWTLYGPILKSGNYESQIQANFVTIQDQLSQQINEFWETDFKDIALTPRPTLSREDKYAIQLLQDNVTMVDGHYELPLPWRPGCPNLPNNKAVAIKRLNHLAKKLDKDKDLKKKYCDEMSKFIEKGFARRVSADDKPEPGKLWYLPHQPVVSDHKPNKVRLVFDGGSRYGNTSLNSQLLPGPDLANNLLGVLLRFRQGKYGILADINSMFLMVRVHDKDWNVLRFLFWPNGDTSLEPVEYNMTVMNFGNSCSPFCANFCLRQTANDFGDEFPSDIANHVKRSAYVDDFLLTADSVEDGRRIAAQTRDLVGRGGFTLSKWTSNDAAILSDIPEKDKITTPQEVEFDPSKSQRVLGVKWFINEDCFGFSTNIKPKPPTKRGVLSLLSSIYDPMGYVSPVILQARMIFQKLCRENLGWDQRIPETDLENWNAWLESLPALADVKLPRCFTPPDFGDVTSLEMHHFGDASQAAYGSLAILRMENAKQEVHCAFVMGRARLCPLKKIASIPRLELTAAALSVKVDMFLRRELNFSDFTSYFWTDSTCVLQIINNTSTRFPTFVSNRVTKINEGSIPTQWNYIPTSQNPADHASRGLTVKEFTKQKTWRKGPEFLWQSKEHWPKPPIQLPELPPELINSQKKSVKILHIEITKEPLDYFIEGYSSWYRLKKATARMIRLKKILHEKRKRTTEKPPPLSAAELRQAELELIKYTQKRTLGDVISTLSDPSKASKSGKSTLRKFKMAPSLRKLNPGLVDGVLRVMGRLRNAPVDFDTKAPIILPRKSHIGELIIREYHQKSHHSGANHTASLLRQKFFIIKGTSTVKKIVNECVVCRKQRAPATTQLMADLPKQRLTPDQAPFTEVGLDNFGPFLIKQGRSTQKRWGLLICCMASRALHLEVVHSLDATSFINALRRFIARRGKVKSIFCDNGTNFTAANKILRKELEVWNSSELGTFYRQQDIDFHFNPPATSHFGGFYERLIRSTRRVLSSLLHEQIVSDETLSTIFCEVESVLNSRPLTPVATDPHSNLPLTPNDLLLFKPQGNLPPGLFDKTDCYSKRRWRQVQFFADEFWRRWTREYLTTLQSRQKWNVIKQNLECDDIVLIVDNTVPRGRWSTGRVKEVYPDKHGLVRQVLVQTARGTLKRGVAKLCLLYRPNRSD